jgi:hypothetical protein
MLEWYKEKDENAARLLGTAGKNGTMTSHKISKRFVQSLWRAACPVAVPFLHMC